MQTKRFHILIDLNNCPPIGKDLLTELLKEVPTLINMEILAGPIIADGIAENPGLSGFVIIDWSHISIHTFSKFNEVLIDVFSCKEYDQKIVIEYLAEKFAKDPNAIHPTVVSWG